MISLLLFLSCGNHKKSATDVISELTQTDDYAILRNQNIASRVVEDFSGRVIVINEKDFSERITAIDNRKGFQYLGQTPCIVLIWAEWCKPCGYQAELMNRLAPDYKGKVIFYKLNIDKAHHIRTAFKVVDIPTILFFKPRGEIVTFVGYMNREKFTQMIADHLLNS
jgi:thioredoxin-like negative regulator of GroEL